jgi:hypothetical protein
MASERPLEELTVTELKERCRAHRIPGYSQKNKQGLIDLLRSGPTSASATGPLGASRANTKSGISVLRSTDSATVWTAGGHDYASKVVESDGYLRSKTRSGDYRPQVVDMCQLATQFGGALSLKYNLGSLGAGLAAGMLL